ncbi:MAG: hypothetical protein ACJA0N_002190 [Pseudohongiellaceae bacterium]|jgi:hypothetical protein
MDITHETVIKQWLESLDEDAGPLVFCRSCHSPITSKKEQATIAHNDHHCFTNPAGATYHLRCFSNAHGCNITGPPTEEYSWFAGYQWQLAMCTECNEHLGWYYQYTRSSLNQRFFFGLIAGRLMNQLG